MSFFWLFFTVSMAFADVQHDDSNTVVKRVADRSERINLVFEPTENWELINRDSHPDQHIELLEFQRQTDALDAHTESAEIFIFHNSWKTDLDQAERIFFRALKEDCPGTGKKNWLRDDLEAPRRITVFSRPEGSSCGNAVIVQLLLQGMDNFYSVNVYLAGSDIPPGLLVKWVQRLKEVKPCFFDQRDNPCPEGLWDATVLRKARKNQH